MSARTPKQARNQAIRLIHGSKSVFIATHMRPDGDALGSLLALALALEKRDIAVARLCVDPAPSAYQFLPGADRIQPRPLAGQRADLGIVVDCDGLARVGELEAALASLPHLVDIDHHATGKVFGDVQIIDARAGACAELVFDLVRGLEVPLDDQIAACLYTGVLTDTGRFCYANTTPRSLRIAAELARAGADPNYVARMVYAQRSIAATHLLGVALSRLSFDFNEKVVSAILSRDDFAATGAVSADTEGIIDQMRAIGGPNVALLLVQLENGEVRVSLRSDGSVDVSEIALVLGGGGHMMAAGCTCPGAPDEVRARVLAELEKRLSPPGPGHAS